MIVKKIESKDVEPWLLNKHYAKRLCHRMYCFGLFIDGVLSGVVTYGMPPSPNVSNGFLGKGHNKHLLELNRLCINEVAPKNAASRLVGRSLKWLAKNTPHIAVVSYADGAMGHIGYVYQATNFIYCGCKKAHDVEYYVDGKWTHAKVLTNRGITSPRKWAKENNIDIKKPMGKHRYIYFLNKSKKPLLRYDSDAYPKGETLRYETSDINLPKENK